MSVAALLAVVLIFGLSSCTEQEPVTENRITEAVISESGSISVSAEFTENTLSGLNKGDKLYLFELTSEMDVTTDIGELIPVAEKKASGRMDFDVPLMDGVRTRRYSSFAVASYDEASEKYTVLTPLASIDMHQGSDSSSEETAPEESIKGLVSESVSGALDLGISHTMVDVNIEKLLLSSWEEDSVAYVYNGVTHYARKSVLDGIDAKVRAYSDAGVNVYIRFLLGEMTADMKNTVSGLYYADVAAGAKSYLVNMDHAETTLRMEGMLDFLARRYSSSSDEYFGYSKRFVIGRNVNNSAEYANAGDITLGELVVAYEKLVRIADSALALYNNDSHAYISIDHNWLDSTGDAKWHGQTFLSAFSNEAEAKGDYPWYVACEPYVNTPTVWAQGQGDANKLTFDSLSQHLTELLDTKKYKYRETELRRVLLCNVNIPGVITAGSEAGIDVGENQAASYVYAYYCAVENGAVEALLYGSYFDGEDSSSSGLVSSLTDASVASASKKIYEVFRTVDVGNSTIASDLATRIIGLEFSRIASSVGERARPVTRVSGSVTSGDLANSVAYYTFSGNMCGFDNTYGVSHTEFLTSAAVDTSYLCVVSDNAYPIDKSGIQIKVSASEFIGATELVVPLYAGDNQSSVKDNTVTLRILRESKGRVSDSDGDILYDAEARNISGSLWQTVSFNISDFTSRIDSDDTLIISLLAKTPSANDGRFGIQSISVKGATNTSDFLSTLLIILVLALIIGLIAAVVYMLWKRGFSFNLTKRKPSVPSSLAKRPSSGGAQRQSAPQPRQRREYPKQTPPSDRARGEKPRDDRYAREDFDDYDDLPDRDQERDQDRGNYSVVYRANDDAASDRDGADRDKE